ncbi:MAG: tetraether lipid synthase Tes [Candidatus Bathyarchaeia archaeon]
MRRLKRTRSICPECFKAIDAIIYEEDGQVKMKKECPEHGAYEDVYWSSFDQYVKAQRYSVMGDGVENPMTECVKGHPFDCGLCPNHKSHTALAIIDVTNRCNLRCPICFANAAVAGYVYEPTQDQIMGMLKTLRSIRPLPVAALQFSGGEPTVREDLPVLIRMAKELGFNHVEVNSNGIRLAESTEYCKELLDAGVSTIYLQFDGVTAEPYLVTRGKDLLQTKLRAIENCRRVGLDSIVLVPTVVRGVNDDQLGPIIGFAAENFDVVRCVNFQPVSITGRIDRDRRREVRITIPECLERIEEQTDGQIRVSDFYPVPFVVPISRAVGALKGKRYVEFTTHEHCGMATFILLEDDKLVPITGYGDVEKFVKAMDKVYEEAVSGSVTRARLRMISALRYVRFGLIRKLIWAVLRDGTYRALGNLMNKMLMVGMMHFMDPYNFDLERAERCCIHYAVPDGRVIPFCTMNTLHRASVEKKFSVPAKEWRGSSLDQRK